MTHSPVRVQVDPTSAPSIPSWMEEVAAVAHILTQTGIISAIQEQVQFARARFGTYDTIDCVIVLLSYALSGEPTLKAFYDRLAPLCDDVAALFHRHHLPSRSALSRFLAALDEHTVEALRTQFLRDLFERTTALTHSGGVWDRLDQQYVVLDVDGTRQVARQRALPHLATLPEPHRRVAQVAEPGYTGRKRGEVVRTRTTVLQAHSHQWLGTDRGELATQSEELQRACLVASAYASKLQLHASQMLLRLDGAYGDTAVLSTVLARGLGLIVRSRDYALLGRPEVLAALAHAPSVRCTHPESGAVRDLYDCPAIRLVPTGPWVRLLIATHAATNDPPSVGQKRNGLVYELFVSTVLAPAMSANDLLDLYLHRGSFETVLADEDWEQDPDRWCSRTPCGQVLLANSLPVGVESAPGVRPPLLSSLAAHDGLCLCEPSSGAYPPWLDQRTQFNEPSSGGHRRSLSRRTRLWSSSMGTTILYRWFSRIGFSSSSRWEAAVSSRVYADRGRTPTGACWLGACLVCRVA